MCLYAAIMRERGSQYGMFATAYTAPYIFTTSAVFECRISTQQRIDTPHCVLSKVLTQPSHFAESKATPPRPLSVRFSGVLPTTAAMMQAVSNAVTSRQRHICLSAPDSSTGPYGRADHVGRPSPEQKRSPVQRAYRLISAVPAYHCSVSVLRRKPILLRHGFLRR